MKVKYLLFAVTGLALLIAAEITKNDYTEAAAYLFMIWGIFGDIADGIQWHKVTNINAKNAFVERKDDDNDTE
jgi:hypothetical protein